MVLSFSRLPSVSLSNTCLCVSLWRWTTPLWLENPSHRLVPRSSHTTILWRPATSVSSPPTVSRVSRPHLVKIASYCPAASFFFFLIAIWRLTSFGIVPADECLLAPDLTEWLQHPKVDCVVTNECQTVGIRWYFSCRQSPQRQHVSQWDLSSWNFFISRHT